MQAWSRRGLGIWTYGGCGGMEARSGGLEGVRVWRFGGRVGMEVLKEVEDCGDGRKLWRRQEALIRLLKSRYWRSWKCLMGSREFDGKFEGV